MGFMSRTLQPVGVAQFRLHRQARLAGQPLELPLTGDTSRAPQDLLGNRRSARSEHGDHPAGRAVCQIEPAARCVIVS